MNTLADINHRLLRLFPVQLVKDYFQLEGTQAVMLNILREQKDSKSIHSFINQNFGYLKQHVYIIKLDKPCAKSQFNEVARPFPLGVAFQGTADERLYSSFPVVKYKGVYESGNSYSSFEMDFWQPTRLEFRDDNTVIFYAGIIEKNVSTYLGENSKAGMTKKSNNDDFLSVIMEYFLPFSPTMCDFNKGIKALIDKDELDFISLKYKDTHSLTHELMDGARTFKREYPEKYTILTSKPVQKSHFRYLINDNNLTQHFTADPCKGTISVPIFPEHLNQVANVVTEILRSN